MLVRTSLRSQSVSQHLICGNIQVNPARAPEVVGALLDAEAPDEFVNNLILSVRSLIPVERLCAEVEKRNRLKLLSPFLEHLVSEGSQVSSLLRLLVLPSLLQQCHTRGYVMFACVHCKLFVSCAVAW